MCRFRLLVEQSLSGLAQAFDLVGIEQAYQRAVGYTDHCGGVRLSVHGLFIILDCVRHGLHP